jgi:hypothetical protein
MVPEFKDALKADQLAASANSGISLNKRPANGSGTTAHRSS